MLWYRLIREKSSFRNAEVASKMHIWPQGCRFVLRDADLVFGMQIWPGRYRLGLKGRSGLEEADLA